MQSNCYILKGTINLSTLCFLWLIGCKQNGQGKNRIYKPPSENLDAHVIVIIPFLLKMLYVLYALGK